MIEQLNWFKSSYSGQPQTDCVEAAFHAATTVKVRDSKNPDGAHHAFECDTWMSFISAVKHGEIGV
ncbi:DUF397 domain-containing protein [Streptomyces sp. NPDC057199]|uniref:DUF397 domain-containing protein n=1 Tax=Streptomyces sp. NPDC057199 TaxID=3346047 RepID=UPI00363D02D2